MSSIAEQNMMLHQSPLAESKPDARGRATDENAQHPLRSQRPPAKIGPQVPLPRRGASACKGVRKDQVPYRTGSRNKLGDRQGNVSGGILKLAHRRRVLLNIGLTFS
jgi:hypothetical protein